MDVAKFLRIKTAFERNGGSIESSAELDKYLALRGADAITLHEKLIILRLNPPPTTSEIFEELIHTAQCRCGDISTGDTLRLEIEAKEKLLKYQKQYGIPDIEHEQTRRQLEDLTRRYAESR